MGGFAPATAAAVVGGFPAVLEGGVTIVAAADEIDFAAADFNITASGTKADVALAGSSGGIDVQEGGASVVTALTLNFDEDDFAITDEGGNVAGIALDATLYTGFFLAIDGSNRMQPSAAIRTLSGELDFQISDDISNQTDSFADGVLNTAFWEEKESSEANISQAEAVGHYQVTCDANIVNMSQTTGYAGIITRNSYQGDFDVIARLVNNRAGGSSLTDNGIRLAAINAADWTGGAIPASADLAQCGGNVSSPLNLSYTGSITGTGGTKVARAVTDWWVRITRVGTTITTYYGTSAGTDVPPGSWTTFQTKAAAGLDDEVRFAMFYLATGTTGTSASGSYGRFPQFTVVSADTINGTGEVPGPAWQMDIAPTVTDGGTLLRLRHDVTLGAVTAFEWLTGANGPQLSFGDGQDALIGLDEDETAGDTLKIGLPSATSRRLIICDDADIDTDSTVAASNHPQLMFLNGPASRHMMLFVNDTDGVIECGVDQGWHLDLQRRTGDVRLFNSVDSEANQRVFKINYYDDSGGGNKRTAEFYGSSNFFWIEADSGSDGLIMRHDGSPPLIRLLQTGSTSLADIQNSTITSVDTVRLQVGQPAASRGLLSILARTTATAAPGALNLVTTAGTGCYLSATTAFRLQLWENTDPGTAAGTPEGHLPVIKSKSGSEYSTGLEANIDIGVRTDAPESALFMNVGGTYRRIGFGACAAYANIFNSGTDLGQTVVSGAPELFTQFDQDFALERRATAAAASSKITVDAVGIYHVTFTCSGTSDVNNTLVQMLGYVDGTHEDTLHCEAKVGTGGDYLSMSFNGLVNIGAGEDLEVYCLADNNCDLTFDECSLTLLQVG